MELKGRNKYLNGNMGVGAQVYPDGSIDGGGRLSPMSNGAVMPSSIGFPDDGGVVSTDQNSIVSAGATKDIEITVDRKFWAQVFMLDSSTASYFKIIDMQVAGSSILASRKKSSISGGTCSEVSTTPFVLENVFLDTNQPLVVTVKNTDTANRRELLGRIIGENQYPSM